jgi:hypothetical protein
VASSQPSIYKGHIALDPLVRRLGTPVNLRGGVSKTMNPKLTRVVNLKMIWDFFSLSNLGCGQPDIGLLREQIGDYMEKSLKVETMK